MMNLRQHRAGFVQHMVFHRVEGARQGEAVGIGVRAPVAFNDHTAQTDQRRAVVRAIVHAVTKAIDRGHGEQGRPFAPP